MLGLLLGFVVEVDETSVVPCVAGVPEREEPVRGEDALLLDRGVKVTFLSLSRTKLANFTLGVSFTHLQIRA